MNSKTALPLLLSLSILSSVTIAPVNAQLSESELLPMHVSPADAMRFGESGKAPSPDKLERKTRLEDLFRRKVVNVFPVDPVDLSGVKIPGLLPKNVSLLGANSFVVVNDTNYTQLSDAYKENRLNLKPNFVTVDALLHPYFGFSNGLLGSVIEETIHPELMKLLVGMLASSMADYRNTQDDEVKDDVQRNLAYISLALKLLEPKVRLPDIGGAIELVNADYETVMSGKPGHSVICNLDEDFSYFKPWGWMDSSERLRRFFRGYQWLSRMYFPLSDITHNTVAGGGNSFRRAVLLYRSLVLAKSDNESSLVHWNRIATVLALTGLDEPCRKKSLIPPELAPILKTSGSDLAGLLKTLEQPFLRTKLMLSIRRQRPVELGATSIFDVGKKTEDSRDSAVVRLFPVVQPPEMPWIKENSKDYAEAQGPQPMPIALLVLHTRGAVQATNVLSDLVQYLDSRLLTSIPKLERTLDRKNKLAVPQPDRHWDIIASLFEPCADPAQRVVRSEAWLTRQLETAICAWIDSYVAYNPIPKEKPQAAGDPAGGGSAAGGTASGAAGTETPGAPSTSGGAAPAISPPPPAQVPPSQPPSYAGSPPAGTVPAQIPTAPAQPSSPQQRAAAAAAAMRNRLPQFQYLDPRPVLYKNVADDLKSLTYQLTALNCFPARYSQRSQDFIRLFERLCEVSQRQLAGEPMRPADTSLLANIDQVLTPVDNQVAGTVYFAASTDSAQATVIPAQAADAPAPQEKVDGDQRGALQSINLFDKTLSGGNATGNAGLPAKSVVGGANTATNSGATNALLPGRNGATLGIGRAGRLYVVCQTPKGAILARGSVYTYYEVAGGPIKAEHWQRKLGFGMLRPPYWASRFDLMQDTGENNNIR